MQDEELDYEDEAAEEAQDAPSAALGGGQNQEEYEDREER